MITCVTRSMNSELYNMMLSLCPPEWRFIRVLKSSAHNYLDYIFTTDFGTKWVLNLDEDCFVTDYNAIYRLTEYLEKNDFDYSGMQDGGSVPVRIHNPLVSNPFFNLFNSAKILPLEKTYFNDEYKVKEIANKYAHLIRFQHNAYKFDLYEPFYQQFFWLLENGLKPYFVNAREFSQERYLVIAPILRIVPYYNNPTLLLDHEGSEIAIHTWHSRYYYYPNIKKRINNCYKYASKFANDSQKKVEIIQLNK